MSPRFYILFLTIGLPTLVQGYVIGTITLMFGMTRKPHFDGPVLAAWWRPWVEKRWNFATTIGAFMGKPTWWNPRVRFHEWRHVLFYVFLNALGLTFAGIDMLGPGDRQWWVSLLMFWAPSGCPMLIPAFVVAAILNWRRGLGFMKGVYYPSIHEQEAYAVTKTFFDHDLDPWEHHHRKDMNSWTV